MPRFITVTCNPALDRNYGVAGFVPGEVNRAKRVTISAGGKGVNVARVLHTLGAEVVATGFLGGAVGEQIGAMLAAEAIPTKFVDIGPRETRTAVIVVDELSGAQTVVNEEGPAVDESDTESLDRRLGQMMAGADYIVFSGTLAPGMKSDTYARWIRQAAIRGILTLIDSSGDALVHAAAVSPSVVKVNASEGRAIGVVIQDWDRDVANAAGEGRARLGVSSLAITGGALGAVLAVEGGVFSARTVGRVAVASAVGSGDSFAAGLAFALADDPADPAAALRLASACGAANALCIGGGACSREQIASVSGMIQIDRLA